MSAKSTGDKGVQINNAAAPRVAPPKAKSENPTKPPGSKAQKSSEQSNKANAGDNWD